MWQIFENLWSRFYDLAAWFWWASGKIREDFSWFPFGAADWLAGGVQWLGDLSNAISRGMLWLYQWFSAIELEGFFANFVGTLRTIVTYYWGKISWFFVVLYDKACSVLGDLWDRLADFLYNLYDRLWQLAVALWDRITDFFVNWYWAVKDLVVSWADKVNWLFGQVWDRVSAVFTQLWDKIEWVFTVVWARISSVFTELWDRIQWVYTELWGRLSWLLAQAWDRITWLCGDWAWGRIWFYLTNGWDLLTRFVTDPLGTIWAIIYPTLLKRIEEYLNERWDAPVG